jgi:hypothetical protein
MPENTVIGKGLNVIRSKERSQGVVRYLKTPMDVMNLMRAGNLENTVVLARAGTVTFVGPVLPRNRRELSRSRVPPSRIWASSPASLASTR